MTENIKEFLEKISNEDEEFISKLTQATKEELIAIAAEKGVTLTDADFEEKTAEGEVSIEEAEAVAGGKKCYCVGGGVGQASEKNGYTDEKCVCVAYGDGSGYKQISPKNFETIRRHFRCQCFATGEGASIIA